MTRQERIYVAEFVAWSFLLMAMSFLVVPILMGEARHMSSPICENGFFVFGFACCAFFVIVFVIPDE